MASALIKKDTIKFTTTYISLIQLGKPLNRFSNMYCVISYCHKRYIGKNIFFLNCNNVTFFLFLTIFIINKYV